MSATRRAVLQGVTASIAAAVTPSFAWATSSDDGLVTGQEAIKGPGGPLPVFWARPEGDGPFPVILVAHEIFGVHAWITEVCRRFARSGFLAVAPYLYSRQGEVANKPSIDAIIADVVAKVSQATVLADLDATLAWATKHARGDAKRTSITGFCWGGTVAWLYAAQRPDLRAAVAWYGRLAVNESKLTPHSPLRLASKLTVPTLGLYGGLDTGIPLTDVEAMRAAVSKGSSGSDLTVYPEAGHGFLADYRPSYHEASARAAWLEAHSWLQRHGAR